MPTPNHRSGTTTAEAVADAVSGTWTRPPSEDWRLRRVVKAAAAMKAAQRMRDILVPVSNPVHSLPGLQDSKLSADAAVLLVQDEVPPKMTRFAVLQVRSIEEALKSLATVRRNEFSGQVIAVTGSVGKTSTTAMIGAALSTAHETYCSRRAENALSTICKHCIQFTNESHAVVEISRLGLPDGAFILRPDVAVVTAISEAHLHDMGSLEATARFKATLFEGMNPSGTAVVNRDTPHADILLDAARAHASRIVTYGTSVEADARLLNYDPDSGKVDIAYYGDLMSYYLGNPGRHNAINSLAALCAIGAVGGDAGQFADTFKDIRARTGRGETSEVAFAGKQVTLVDQSYNANPLSVEAALEDFGARFAKNRRVLVLGEMLELGPTEAELHAALLDPVLQAKPALVYAFGPLMKHLWARIPDEIRGAHLTTVAQARAVLENDLQDGDAVLIKASRATGLHKFVKEQSRESAGSDKPISDTESASSRSGVAEISKSAQSWRVTVSGPTVQGVGYRRAVRSRATAQNMRGWVRNRTDGKVEALLHGDSESLADMYAFLHTGPTQADVSRVVAWKVDVVPRDGFRIRRRRTI